MKALIKRFVLTVVLFSCLLLVAIEQGFSWYAVTLADDYISPSLETGWIEDDREWERHHARLTRATRFVSLSSRVYWQLGELHHLRAAGLNLWPEQQNEQWEKAKRYYFSALERSPEDGALLARIASRLALTRDLRAMPLLRRAIEIAPYEPLVHYHLAETGMRLWADLDPKMKESFRSMMKSALQNYKTAAAIKDLARRNNWLDILEAL